MKFATKLHDVAHFTLGVLLHYLEKLKLQTFCRYSAIIPDMEENVNKLHINAQILIPLHVQLCMLSVFMYFYQNLVLVAEYHVDR